MRIKTETVGPPGFGRDTATVHVLPQHERELRDFTARVNRRVSWMLVSIELSLLVGVVGTLLVSSGSSGTGALLAGIGAVGVGATLLACPSPTPPTVALLGIARSVLFVRVFALMILVLGLVVIALAALSPILTQG
jgi:hypothetical protein